MRFYLVLCLLIFSIRSNSETLVNASGLELGHQSNYLLFYEIIGGIPIYGVVDTNGLIVLEKKYVSPDWANLSISEDVFLGKDVNSNTILLVDLRNRESLISGTIKDFRPFENGYAIVRTENIDYDHTLKAFFINRDGNKITELPPNASLKLERHGSFYEGLARISLRDSVNGVISRYNKGYCYIDSTGTIVIDGPYIDAGDFHEGLATAQKLVNGVPYWGFINKHGESQIDFKYENRPSAFCEGIAIVKFKNGQYQYIDTNGQAHFLETFLFASGFYQGTALIQDLHKNFYIIDSTGSRLYNFTDIFQVTQTGDISEQKIGLISDFIVFGSFSAKLLGKGSELYSIKLNGQTTKLAGFNEFYRISANRFYARAQINSVTQTGVTDSTGTFIFVCKSDKY